MRFLSFPHLRDDAFQYHNRLTHNTIGLAYDHGEYEMREDLKESWRLKRSPSELHTRS